MKETVTAFVRRTHLPYDPPQALQAIARKLSAAAPCPTLFRFPGPEGLQDLLRGSLRRLAPARTRWVWLADAALHTSRRSAREFGAVAVLEPLRWKPCAAKERGRYLAVNLRAQDPDAIVWVPPSVVGDPINWDRVRSAPQARRLIGRSYREEEGIVTDRLGAYIDELSEMRRAGAPGPPKPWCEMSATLRRRLLADYGVKGRWTR